MTVGAKPPGVVGDAAANKKTFPEVLADIDVAVVITRDARVPMLPLPLVRFNVPTITTPAELVMAPVPLALIFAVANDEPPTSAIILIAPFPGNAAVVVKLIWLKLAPEMAPTTLISVLDVTLSWDPAVEVPRARAPA